MHALQHSTFLEWSGVAVQVAVVRNAGTPESKRWIATLGDVEAALQNEDLSPCIIIIGRTVGDATDYL